MGNSAVWVREGGPPICELWRSLFGRGPPFLGDWAVRARKAGMSGCEEPGLARSGEIGLSWSERGLRFVWALWFLGFGKRAVGTMGCLGYEGESNSYGNSGFLGSGKSGNFSCLSSENGVSLVRDSRLRGF